MSELNDSAVLDFPATATERGVWDGSAEFWQVDGQPILAEQYHADRECVSRSQLEDFRRSPALYHGRHVTGIYPREESPALAFGSAFHSAVLEPDSDTGIVVIPESVLSKSGSRAGAAWEAFKAENAGKTLMKRAEFEPIALMMAGIRADSQSEALIHTQPGRNECSIRWTCPRTGLRLRCRMDRLLDDPAIIVDLKSTPDASTKAFGNAVATYGYHRQAAFYQDAAEALTGDRMEFVFVAVAKEPPYDAMACLPNARLVERGREENYRALERFAKCLETGAWHSETHNLLVELPAPGWAFDDKWEMA